MKEFTIGYRQAGQRLDKYLAKVLSQAPKSFLYRMLRKKNIVLNGKKASGSEIIREGDTIKIWFSDETFERFSHRSSQKTGKIITPDPLKCPVIYEDEDIVVMNKPQGILSQKAGSSDYSMNEWMIDYLIASGSLKREELLDFRPAVCNRLDRNTSGLLLAGKSVRGLQWASGMLKERTVKKFYRCIVRGEIREADYRKAYLRKDHRTNKVYVSETPIADARLIETSWESVCVFPEYTYLEVHLITGRSHQIRAHLASAGYPMLGDPKYGDPRENAFWKKTCGIRFQLLHACRMEFPDGKTFTADVPESFRAALKILEENAGRKKQGNAD